MRRLTVPNLWISLPGLQCRWFRKDCVTNRYFYALMIQWSPNLVRNLKMFPNSLTMLHIMARTILMDTALSAWCYAFLCGKRTELFTSLFPLAMIFHKLKQKKSEIIMWVSVRCLQICAATDVSTHMWRQAVTQQKPNATGCITYLYFFTHFAGILSRYRHNIPYADILKMPINASKKCI